MSSSSSESEDLFGASSDSGEDTDELMAASSSSQKIAKKKNTVAVAASAAASTKKNQKGASGGVATKKKLGASRLTKKSNANRKEEKEEQQDSDEEARGLFDSDEEDDGDDDDEKDTGGGKKKAKKDEATLSKRERMEALKKKARKAAGLDEKSKSESKKSNRANQSKARGGGGTEKEKETGYDSGDSYDSGVEYERTQEDDDFIDVEGEDEEAIKEYYKEQHFDDERPDDHEEGIVSGSKKGSSKKRGRGPDGLSEADKKDQDNPIMAAVNRMKKKKKVVKTFEDLKIAAEDFVTKMEYAADEDDLAIKEKRPGLKKLQMLPEALDIMTNREMIRPLLESDLLSAVKRWIQPLPDGSLGNVTVRQSMIEAIAKMGTGEDHGVDTDDLKKSGFGKLVMVLYNHKQETPPIKKQLKKLIEEWSRTIFGKSGNMRDLASVQSVRMRKQGLTAYSRPSANIHDKDQSSSQGQNATDDGDIGAVLSKGVKQARDLGRNRVRIPVSKGFQYTVRPSDLSGDVTDKKTRISNVADKRESLHKRMLEKSRPVSKNARSANISIEGRPTKG